jgi:hypothetical protein
MVEDEYGVDKGDPDPYTGAIMALVVIIILGIIFL